MNDNEKLPNPYGKLGGIQHRKKVEEVELSIQNRGFKTIKEFLIRLFGKKKRFIDVAAIDKEEMQLNYTKLENKLKKACQ